MTPAATTPPPPIDPERRAHALVNELARLLPTDAKFDDVFDLVEGVSPEERQDAAAVGVDIVAKTKERSRVRNIERAARRAGRKSAIEAEKLKQRGNLYLGEYLHGWLDPREGAVSRGCPCDECEQARRYQKSVERKFSEAMRIILDSFQEIGSMKWTWALLNRTFKPSDGTNVYWGKATYEQHEKRFNFLVALARGILETASQHQAAMATLNKAKTANLDEAVAKGYST